MTLNIEELVQSLHLHFNKDMELSKNGFSLNHARILVGSGLETYEKGKTAATGAGGVGAGS